MSGPAVAVMALQVRAEDARAAVAAGRFAISLAAPGPEDEVEAQGCRGAAARVAADGSSARGAGRCAGLHQPTAAA